MQTGRTADLAAILDRADAVGARVLIDATQASRSSRSAPCIDRIDYLARRRLQAPALSARRGVPRRPAGPRGRAAAPGRQLAGSRRAVRALLRRPADAGAGCAPARRVARLAAVARRGGVAASARGVGAERGVSTEVVDLARELAALLGVRWTGASLVCAPIDDPDAARIALAAAGVRASVRGTAIRLAPHVYTTRDDVERAVAVLEPLIAR